MQVLRRRAFEFLERNRDADDWLLQIETFDPHEPFYAPDRFKDAVPHRLERPDPRLAALRPAWSELPRRGRRAARQLPARLMALCDDLLGKILDEFDAHDLWKDTALIVTTDHGFLLGEHDFWAKNRMTMYEEIAHIPLFVHDPRAPRAGRVEAADPVHRHRRHAPRPLRRDPAAPRARAAPCSAATTARR